MTQRDGPRRTKYIAALVVAGLTVGSPAVSQEGVAELSRFGELKTELMTRLRADDPAAVPLAEEVLALTARLFGPQHPENVTAVVHLAYAQQKAGRIQEARSHYELAVRLAERLLGPGHPLTGVVLYHFGNYLAMVGELGHARQLLERSLSIEEASFLADSVEVATSLNALGNLLHALGDLDGARRRLSRVVEILEKRLGPNHPETGAALNNLAMVLQDEGDLKAAQELMEKVLKIDRIQFGDGHLKTAVDYNNLGLILSHMGDLGAARFYLEKALAIYQENLPAGHPDIAGTLVNLGSVLNQLRLYSEAEKVLARAEEIQEAALGDAHPNLTCTRSGLQAARDGQAAVASMPFDWDAALRDLSTFSPDSRSVAVALNNAACSDAFAGDPEAAVDKLRRVLAAQETSLGPDHPDLIPPLVNLATILDGIGRSASAVSPTARALDIEEAVLANLMERGALEEAETFLEKLVWNTTWVLTLQLRAGEDAVRLGLTTVLRRKGRDLDVRFRPQGALDDPEADELMTALRRTREEWTFLHLQGASIGGTDSEKLCRLTARLRLLGGELRKFYHRLGKPSSTEVTVAAVQRRLPEDAALIEFVLFDPFDNVVQPEEAAPRYLAYILHPEGEPSWMDLGEAETIDRAVAAFRDSLDGAKADVKTPARRLNELTLERIQPLLRGVTRLFLSPDGTLNLVPFAALVDQDGSYLLKRYNLSYLSSGRDLLHGETVASREEPLILGDPEFGRGPAVELPGWSALSHARLPGTEKEANGVARALGLDPSRLLLGAAARESAVKKSRAPRILHIATHGFFFGDPTPDHEGLPACLESPPALDPLLRSGLLLSEAHPPTPADDGILTATEVMDLDLAGTEIVTLSACETGVGELRPGRGVYGLRRALVLAGARAQMMSLWQVDDWATAALMKSFYAQVAKGTARGDALRSAQLAAMKNRPLPVTGVRLRSVSPRLVQPVEPTHPFFWSGFILAGETGPLETVPANIRGGDE